MLVVGLGGPIGVMDALVGVNSIWLGPDVLGPGGVGLGLVFPCFTRGCVGYRVRWPCWGYGCPCWG